MSNRLHRSAVNKHRRAESNLPQSTMLSVDNYNLLLSKDSLTIIADHVSDKYGRSLNPGEIKTIVGFVKELPERQYVGKPLVDTQLVIANQYIKRVQTMKESMSEEDDIVNVTELTDDTDEPGMQEYQKKEIGQYSANEHPTKHATFHNRRGNAYVDARKDNQTMLLADRSTPDNVKASASEVDYARDSYKMLKLQAKYLKTMVGVFGPEHMDEMLHRTSKDLQTYQSISLPRNPVPLDSRFRKVEHPNPQEYRWELHPAGAQGHPGDVQLQDTIQEVVQMRICPFWIPVTDIDNQYYSKIRLLIKEFKNQSWQGTEFTAGNQVKRYNFHFEFDVERDIGRNRFLLTPCNAGIFTFKKPVSRVESITICMLAPFELILPNKDRLLFTVTFSNPAVFTATEPHNLSTGDLVYIMNLASSNMNANIDVNRDAGHIITRLNSTQFSIPVDLSAVPGGPATNVEVQFGSKRILINIEFISLEQ